MGWPEVGDTVTIVAHDVGGAGGMELQLQELITRLLERQMNVVVVSRTLKLAPHSRLRWHRVPGTARPFALAYPWFALAASLMLIRRRMGVLHTTGAIVLNRADVCTVHYLHNGPGGSLARMRYPTPLYRLNAAAARRMSRLFERVSYSSPTLSRTLVAVSAPLMTELIEQFPARTRSVHLIRNGVDTQRFQPNRIAHRSTREALGLGDQVPLALFVGSEWLGKRVDIAVEALVDSPSWHLAIVGRGDEQALWRSAEHLGVGERLHIVGEVTDPERYYAAADAFVLPSAYETFSLAAFEAAASGVPVVATHVGAIEEIVTAGGGIFVEQNATSVAAALRYLETHPDDALTMSERAREKALSFDWDAVADDYVSLYKESNSRRHPSTVGSAAP